MPDRSYFTTTLPYANAAPHLGFALELVQADATARHARLTGQSVFLNTGTDEHGLKIFQKSQERNQDPQEYVNEYADKFKKLTDDLNISEHNFIRTTDKKHIVAAEEFWRRCKASGDIYKKIYKIKYCVGCEMEVTDSELVDGKCPDHQNMVPEIIEEENYFFRFSKYQTPLLDFYNKNPNFIAPATRFKELRAFVERGLEDFSISRLTAKQPWGITIPDDPAHTMYVWFDALVNYLSAVGWPSDEKKFKTWWPAMQFAGKDNLRQQAAMWQAMLMSVDLPPSKQIVIHGFITSAGQKMSKSLGNVADPFALIKEYGADAVRYYLLRHIHPFEDSDFTFEKFTAAYNADLANGLGNLVSRVLTMSKVVLATGKDYLLISFPAELTNFLDHYEFNRALDFIWQKVNESDKFIQNTKPFESIKTNPIQAKTDIEHLVGKMWQIACWLKPFLPTTAEKIRTLIQTNQPPATPLFPRK